MVSFCDNPLENWVIGVSFFGNDQVGIFKLIVGILYIVMALITVLWINIQSHNARRGDNEAVKSVIFPIFTIMMWISAFTSLSVAIVILFIPVDLTERNRSDARYLYPAVFTLQHIVLEGVAFLLMQKGCGKYAAWNASKLMLVWGIITLIANIIGYSPGFEVSIAALLTWDACILVFYFLLWVLPQNRLFRRPAAIPYAKFWFFFRVLEISLYSMSQAHQPIASQIGKCGYVFGPLLIFTIFQPIVMYWTLLADSRWWQGVDIEITGRHSIHSPLGGIDISLYSAQTLARTMDELCEQKTTRLLNFAHIEIDRHKLLGQGSFSRVYRGTYREQKCAIKLIYTMDLTEDVIQRVAAEANILSSMKNPNIVKIYGISVLPPSVCILLELCTYGSLSDILRGDTGTNVRKVPLKLTLMDRLYLALGCARGLAALHSLGPEYVHRDIKSLNFLVDGQLNSKLADLELGAETNETAARSALVSDDLLENWAAPELFDNQPYTQKCDVYSLSLVLWEIISGKIPYADIRLRSTIRTMIISGERPQMVECPQPYEELIKIGWSQNPANRPKVTEMVDILERVLSTSPSPAAIRLEALSEIRSIVDAFYQSDCGMEYIQVLKEHRLNYYTRISSHGSFSMTPLNQSSHLVNNNTNNTTGHDPNNNNNNNTNHDSDNNNKPTSSFDGNDIESQNPIQQAQRVSEGNSSSSRSSESIGNNHRNSNSNNSNNNNNNQIPINSSLNRQTLFDIIDLMSETPNYSLLEQLTHSPKHSKLSTELEYVYNQIEENNIWKAIDELADPVLILSGKDPFLILKSSMSWLSMMGCKSSQVFGKIVENFIYFPDPSQEINGKNGLSSQSKLPIPQGTLTGNSQPPNLDQNIMTFQEVTSTLESYYAMLNSANRTSHIHCVLPFQHCTNQSKIKCSIHTFPIFKKLSEEDAPINEKPRYFLQRSSRESTSIQNHSVAFYMVYINSFVVQYDTTPYPAPLISSDGSIPPSVSTTEMSPLSSAISSASITTNTTDNLRKQGLANDL